MISRRLDAVAWESQVTHGQSPLVELRNLAVQFAAIRARYVGKDIYRVLGMRRGKLYIFRAGYIFQDLGARRRTRFFSQIFLVMQVIEVALHQVFPVGGDIIHLRSEHGFIESGDTRFTNTGDLQIREQIVHDGGDLLLRTGLGMYAGTQYQHPQHGNKKSPHAALQELFFIKKD